jgi:hypothetical protein
MRLAPGEPSLRHRRKASAAENAIGASACVRGRGARLTAGRRAGLVACAAVLSACVVSWTRDQTGDVAGFLAAFGLAFGAYLAALHLGANLSARGVAACVAVSLVWRAALLVAPPVLSDDVYRYVWEGRIQLHGGNPYAWEDRPEGVRWTFLRDSVWDGVSHKFMSALYPPAWQLAARAVAAGHDSVLAMKAFLVACEIAALALLALVLRRRGLPPARLLVFAWSPLALLEIAGSGHNDGFAILLLVGALLALETGRPLVSAALGAVAFQAKLLPGFVVAAWARRFRWWHVIAAIAVAAALVVPYAAAGSGLWHSATRYARYWRFNETLYALLRAAFGQDGAAIASAVLVAALALALAWRRAETATAGLAVVAASLLLAANVLPWYALWLLPFLVLRDSAPALLFTGTVALAYLAYPEWRSGESWHVSWGVRALEYGPCVVVAVLARRRRA